MHKNSRHSTAKLPASGANFYSLRSVVDSTTLSRLPFCLRVLAENVMRHIGHNDVAQADLDRLAGWSADGPLIEVPFHPARVLMQDYTGIPSLVDLAALRDACQFKSLVSLLVIFV